MEGPFHPRLAAKCRLQPDPATGRWVLLYPEGLLKLNESAAAILLLCDGTREEGQILEQLSRTFKTPVALLQDDVRATLAKLQRDGLLERVEPSSMAPKPANPNFTLPPSEPEGPRPLGLLAEMTYRCPLHCPYCSNPVLEKGKAKGRELETEEWKDVLRQARELGVLHALFSGGEPLQRTDLEALVGEAHELGFYTNLITSGLGFSAQRGRALKLAGLDSVQLSFQADKEALGNEIAGTKAHALKLETADVIRSLGFPLTVNIVLHRANIDRLESLVALAERLGAHRLELANAQYYGWAFQNRPQLLPTREQIRRASGLAEKARARLQGRMEILFVVPDYFSDRPKPCMNGWGRRYLTVNPFGQVLPCPTSSSIPGMVFENVRLKPLDWIWNQSESFQKFRGFEWMPEPCRSCDRKETDFGGCRCQAALLTGDAAATDPACGLSPFRNKMEEALAESSREAGEWRYRQNPT
jgi:pyrroloquinoline quinone biosynthesis protein E